MINFNKEPVFNLKPIDVNDVRDEIIGMIGRLISNYVLR